MAKLIKYDSQITLPVGAENPKSPIRKAEFDEHIESALHIQNAGEVGTMLVMTEFGPRMMRATVTCGTDCNAGLYFSSESGGGDPDPEPDEELHPSFVTQVSGGASATFFVRENGIWSCGNNSFGQLLRSSVMNGSPTECNLSEVIDDVSSYDSIQIAAGGVQNAVEEHVIFTMAADGMSMTACLGSNVYGQLGTAIPSGTNDAPAMSVIEECGIIKQTACGDRHSVFLAEDGEVWTCGSNAYGQLADIRDSGSPDNPNLELSCVPSPIKWIGCGSNSTWFWHEDNTLWNAGNNAYGQLGRSISSGSKSYLNLNKVTTPFNMADLSQIACGDYHVFFLLNNGRVYCCGKGDYGQLGMTWASGITEIRELTSICGQAPSELNLRKIACGNDFTWFLAKNGLAWNCGNNAYGQLARVVNSGTSNSTNLAPAFETNLKIVDISCGKNQIYCVDINDNVYTAGDNTYGQLGRIVNSGSMSSKNFGKVIFS